MRNLLKILSINRVKLVLLMLPFVITSCKSDGNPWDLADVNPTRYEGNTATGVIKILAIGNSFSEDALEANFYDLAKASGKTVVVGNMYIPGGSLSDHKTNALGKKYIYEYRKIGADGVKKTYKPVSVDIAIEDEQWDYISFQQASPNSGQLETVQASLPAVYEYVKSKATNPNVKYGYHQTWAYAPVTTNTGFANYNNNQLTMYNAIVNVSQNIEPIVPNHLLVPAGTAIQNARTSALGESFNVADGYHLNNLGKYIAACTWFEKIFGQTVVGNTYLGGFSAFEVKVAQNAAHLAVLKPFEITSMSSYEAEPIPLVNSVLLDFGNATPSPSWNQMASYTVGSKINLKDSLNVFVGMSIAVTERFNNINTNGAIDTNTPLNMPNNVSARNFYGNARGPLFGGVVTPQGVFELSGLVKDITYNFSFFGSRAASDNRSTKYTVSGLNQGESTINTASNSTAVATVKNISPDADGKIRITVTAGAGNLTSNGWFYINAAKITSNN